MRAESSWWMHVCGQMRVTVLRRRISQPKSLCHPHPCHTTLREPCNPHPCRQTLQEHMQPPPLPFGAAGAP